MNHGINLNYQQKAREILSRNPSAPECVLALAFYLQACDRKIIQPMGQEDFTERFIFRQSLTGWLFCFNGVHWQPDKDLKGFTLIHRLLTSPIAACEGIPAIDLDSPDFNPEALEVAQNFVGVPLFSQSSEQLNAAAAREDERYKRQLKQAALDALNTSNQEEAQMLIWQAISEGVSFSQEERQLGIEVMGFWPKRQFIQSGILPESMRLDINPAHNEAARNVSKAINRAIGILKPVLPQMAAHFNSCISRESNRFYYNPDLDEQAIQWETR